MHMDIVVDVTHYFVVNDYDHGYNRTQLVAILSKVRVAARNQCGFFTYILYYGTLADWNQALSVIDKYNIGITASQLGKSR